MTSVLQPLDRMINFPLKKHLKSKFSEFLMFENKKNETLSEARKRILCDINEIWNDYSNEYSCINKENIIKSFKITGISNKSAGSEDFMFDGYEVINNLNKNLNKYSESEESNDSFSDNDSYKRKIITNLVSNKESKNFISYNSNNQKKLDEEIFDDKKEITNVINKDEAMEMDYKAIIHKYGFEEDLTDLFDLLDIDKE